MSRFSAKLFIKNLFCPQKKAKSGRYNQPFPKKFYPNFTHFFMIQSQQIQDQKQPKMPLLNFFVDFFLKFFFYFFRSFLKCFSVIFWRDFLGSILKSKFGSDLFLRDLKKGNCIFRCIIVDLWVSYVTIGFGSFKIPSASAFSFTFFVMQKLTKQNFYDT